MNAAQRRSTSSFIALAAALAVCASAGAQDAPEDRVLRSAEGFAPKGGAGEPRWLDERRIAAADVVTKPRGRARPLAAAAAAAAGEVWFFDGTTELFYDNDGDGFFHYLRVRFDADTVWPTAVIYAEVYLSADGKTWELLHASQDFTINGSATDDDYEIESDLVSGYIAAHYDVLVELYDADTQEFLAEYGPAQSSAFSLVPLEDAARDRPPPPPPPADDDDGGGGAMGAAALSALALLLALRRRRGGRAGLRPNNVEAAYLNLKLYR